MLYQNKIDNISPRARLAAFICFTIGLLLAILGLWMLWWFNYDAPFLILMGIFVISISMWLAAAAWLKASEIVTVTLAGFGLAILSFAYQPIGPESRIVGTECQQFSDCYDPVRGGGFPVQYMIDAPGITHWGALGFEDEFRFWHFVADLCFYICLVLIVRWISGYFRLGRVKASVEAG